MYNESLCRQYIGQLKYKIIYDWNAIFYCWKVLFEMLGGTGGGYVKSRNTVIYKVKLFKLLLLGML